MSYARICATGSDADMRCRREWVWFLRQNRAVIGLQ
jgi:hypothetical protein